MFGIPLMTLISLGIQYGPEALSFLRAIDPALHQIATAAVPLAKSIYNSTAGATHETAAAAALDSMTLALRASYDDKAKGES